MIVKKRSASFADDMNAVQILLRGGPGKRATVQGYLVSFAHNALEDFMQMHFGTAAHRVFDVLPVNTEDAHIQKLKGKSKKLKWRTKILYFSPCPLFFRWQIFSYRFFPMIPNESDVFNASGVSRSATRIDFRTEDNGPKIFG